MISVEFKHRRSNFYVFIREDNRLISQLSGGSIVGYSDKSSKRQKIKHVAEQLGELASVKANRIKPNLLKMSPVLYKIYRKLGLINTFFSILTRNNIRSEYVKFKPKGFQRDIKKFPGLYNLYRIATRRYNLGKQKLSNRSLRRYYRLKKKYDRVYGKKIEFNDKFARKTFFRFIYNKRLKRKRRLKVLNVKRKAVKVF